jgi:hypothetical protein
VCESNEKSCFPISDQVDDLDECVSKLVELLGERGVSSYTTSWIYVWILLISVAMQVRTTRHTALSLTMMVIQGDCVGLLNYYASTNLAKSLS